MVYKKYIRRNGRLYGPYIYESKRIDGKVISEYHGSEETKPKRFVLPNKIKSFNLKKVFFVLASFLFFFLLLHFALNSDFNKFSGKAVLQVESLYENGEPLDGTIKFSMKEGELIPSSSKIIFENQENNYEFILSDFIKEEPSAGNFYIEGKNISGEGEGYGEKGERTVYPEISFTLIIYQSKEGDKDEESVNETVLDDESNELPSENTEDTANTIDEISEEDELEAAEDENDELVPITGNTINSDSKFLGLFKISGMVTLELKEEIPLKVSGNNPLEYELKEDEVAEIKPKSVFLGEEELNENILNINEEDGKLIITTDYSENEEGYGEEYIKDKEKSFSLDLSDFNLSLYEGDLNIKLVYNDLELFSIGAFLGEYESKDTIENTDNPIEDIDEIPVTEPENISEESVIDMDNSLSEEEKRVLKEKFGEIFLKTIKSEKYKDRIIVAYEIGEYSIEYTYDVNLDKGKLDLLMQEDRIKFLKDIYNAFSNEEIESTRIDLANDSYVF